MHALKLHRLFLLLAVAATLISGCRKELLFTDDSGVRLEFSRDSILFDTVFTQSPASVIKYFVARNTAVHAVRVDIHLAGGAPSPYRINVDGLSGTSFNDVEILGGDSVFVFVEATLDQTNVNNPLVIEDFIIFNTNGNQQQVLLQAWGQDAYYHVPGPDSIQSPNLPPYGYAAGGFDENGNQICGETVIWPGDKPHVIFGYQVVDSCNTLIIEPGARIHVHAGGGMWVYRYGRLLANGTVDQPITFQGDRLEPFFAELPGQWDRIWINQGDAGADNELTNVVVKNAFIGIQAEWLAYAGEEPGLSANKLILNNVKIRNHSVAGLFTRNYRIESNNLLATDCGQHSVALTGAGEYFFNHTTIANFWSYGDPIRQTPAFIMSDRFQYGNGTFSGARQIQDSHFVNGIIWGNNGNEFQLDVADPATQDYLFQRMIIRTDQGTSDPEHFESIWTNQDPGFSSTADRDFRLLQGSFARNKAIPVPGNVAAIQDIEGKFRDCGQPSQPDLGAFEYCP